MAPRLLSASGREAIAAVATYTFALRWLRVLDFALGVAMAVGCAAFVVAAFTRLPVSLLLLPMSMPCLWWTALIVSRPHAATVASDGMVTFHRVLNDLTVPSARVESVRLHAYARHQASALLKCRGSRTPILIRADPRDLYDFVAAVTQHNPNVTIRKCRFAWFLTKLSSLDDLRALAGARKGPLVRV